MGVADARCRWSWFLLAGVLACGDSTTEPKEAVLDTSPHTEVGGDWGGGMSVSDVNWRFTGLESNVRGSFNAIWHNDSSVDRTISYSLRFFDSEGFQRARDFRLLGPLTVFVPAQSTRFVSATFGLISIDTVAEANAIVEMQIWASFDPPLP